MSTVPQVITADQLFQMPDDGFRYQLVKGELRKMAPAGFNHGKIIINLAAPLSVHVKGNRLGVVLGAETGFKIASDPDTVLAPDIAFIRQERILEIGETDGFWTGAPDLAVEVLSGDTVYDIEEKVAAWLAAGTLMVWVLNPKLHTIRIHLPKKPIQTLTVDDVLDGQEVIPGFRINVAEIFS